MDIAQKLQRFSVPVPEAGCHLWIGSTVQNGYGHMRVGGKTLLAHRVAYENTFGAIPEGMQLDHLCRVRCCINPQHLEVVTPRENTARGNSGAHHRMKTHCPGGHAYTRDNTLVIRTQRGTLGRQCKACNRLRTAAYREAKAQEKAS